MVLANFFGWVVYEGFLKESPTAKIKVAKPKAKVIKPYTYEEINRMLAVCDNDYEHNAKFLGSRNKAIVLVLLDDSWLPPASMVCNITQFFHSVCLFR